MSILDGMTSEEKRSLIEKHNKTHLTRFVASTNPEALEDLILIMVKNVESALITSGATPGKDYTFIDLFNLATPYVLEVWRKSNKIHFGFQDF